MELKNAIGLKLGRLTVVADVPGYTPRRVECVCDCGNRKVSTLKAIKKGYVRSCGCLKADTIRARHIPPVGQKFKQLTLLSYIHGERGRRGRMGVWRCDCGNIHTASFANVMRGTTHSCGCYADKVRKGRKGKPVTHGLSKSVFYRRWRGVITRCNDPKGSSYQKYGAKGVTVCERWMTFENFRDDMHSGWLEHCAIHGEKQTTIDRIDSTKGYEPGNCRWATYTVQMRNRNINHNLEFAGEKLCVSEWAERIGITHTTLSKRLQAGWSIERALTEGLHATGPRAKAANRD